jgi:hypothetical protein
MDIYVELTGIKCSKYDIGVNKREWDACADMGYGMTMVGVGNGGGVGWGGVGWGGVVASEFWRRPPALHTWQNGWNKQPQGFLSHN